jgi:hypothetical protein
MEPAFDAKCQNQCKVALLNENCFMHNLKGKTKPPEYLLYSVDIILFATVLLGSYLSRYIHVINEEELRSIIE